MDDCIFCKIAMDEIPTEKLAENSSAFLIRDRNPIAPHHVLCISKDHYANIEEPYGFDLAGLMSNMIELIQDYVSFSGLSKTGYRIVINTGKNAGQTVEHMHLVGGAPLKNDFGA